MKVLYTYLSSTRIGETKLTQAFRLIEGSDHLWAKNGILLEVSVTTDGLGERKWDACGAMTETQLLVEALVMLVKRFNVLPTSL